ncbi:MAG TPA: SusC/RagA family TonB-linked outer membrane protein [Rikenellaceae bacterium]|nr:SusC/RagA family TonB-linked outer membrane protein [Rikenellaceae bacterium]
MKKEFVFYLSAFVILLSLMFFPTPKAYADDNRITVSGRVVDAKANPLQGVAVIVKGTSVGVETDASGKFSLTFEPSSSGDVVLEFSSVGFKTLTKTCKAGQVLDVTMEDDITFISTVVITGITNIKQESFTGNSVTISNDELLKASKTNVLKAIQNFDPSFRIVDNNLMGSNPNSVPEMYIRGQSGMGNYDKLETGDLSESNLRDNPNLPTFIMDGFEINVTTLYDFDPNRIESITILKDAAATALYGSRAANGVVVITTVKPKPGKLNVSYNFTGSVTAPDLSDYHLLNAADKLELERQVGFYDIAQSDGYTPEYTLKKEYYEKLANVKEGVDTYWMAKPLRTVFNNNHSLYIDGGSNSLRFGIDVKYSNQDGVMKGSKRDNLGAGAYIQYNYKNVNIRNYFSYTQTNSADSPYGDFSKFVSQLPYDKYMDENGRILEKLRYWGSGTAINKENPMYEATLHNFAKQKREEIINNLSVNWHIIPSLLFKGQLSLTKEMNSSDTFYDPKSKQSGNLFPLSDKNISSGTYNMGDNDGYSIDLSATLSYNTRIEKHAINALAGFNLREDNTTSKYTTYIGFPSGLLSSPMYAKEVYKKGTFYEDTKRMLGALASVNYAYDDTYLLDASFRLDGSSAFGADKRFAPFWSGGLGINIHKYDFMKDLGWINRLKVRGSFGQTGKANFPAYDARSSYVILSDEWYKTGYGAVLKALGNSKLKWETTNTLDFGAELGLWDDLVYARASYYDKRTVDLITSVTLPSSAGFSSYKDNVGEISNKGFELDLRVNPIRNKDWNLILNLNMAHNKNRIEKISNSMKAYNEKVIAMYRQNLAYNDSDREKQTMPFLQYVEGGSLNSIYGVRSLGINPVDGEEIFLSRTGDIVNKWDASDQVVLGTTEPKAQGSFGFNLTYKQFSLYASFMYEFGAQRYNQTLVDKVENVNVYASNVDERVMEDRWMKPGDVAKYKKISVDRNVTNFTKPTSRFVQDYNSLSLSSVELAYEMPRALMKKIHFSTMKFTVGMNDIFHLQSIEMERGTSYPYARTVNFSVKFTL